MEDGTASTGGSNDRHKTVPGPFPNFEDPAEDAYVHFNEEPMKLPWSAQPSSTPSAPSTAPSPTARSTGHKRTISGNLLGRLNFLRSNSTGEEGRPPSREKEQQPLSPKSARSTKSRKSVVDDNDGVDVQTVSPVKGQSAMAAALGGAKNRKRKGSLRKTALLGGRRLMVEGRERKNSFLQRSPSKQSPPALAQQPATPSDTNTATDSEIVAALGQDDESNTSLRRELSYENVSADNTGIESGWSESAAATLARLTLVTSHADAQGDSKEATELSSPLNLTSPASQASYMSTTDDDDVLTFDSRTSSFGAQSSLVKKPLSTGSSYFPSVASVSQESLPRRLSGKKSRSSPLSHSMTSPSTYSEPEPHDYTETEYWGWIILIITWVVFTVGMGSCLEIWSWAWDVGETPYAPPELEDDETLPIVGYYPALIVLTGVVAWIWITIAWLGMKYFRHAKIEV